MASNRPVVRTDFDPRGIRIDEPCGVQKAVAVQPRQAACEFALGICAMKELWLIGQRVAVSIRATAFADEVKQGVLMPVI
jgi:hypothetical protein